MGYAESSFPGILNFVPDFSVMTLNKSLEGDTQAVLVLGDEGETLGPCGVARKKRGISRGCCGRSPYESDREAEGCVASTSRWGERPRSYPRVPG